MKVAFDKGAVGLGAAQVGANVADHLFSIQRASAADGVGFDVLVEILVGIEFGAVARQKVNSQGGAAAFEPAQGCLGHMDRMTVDDQEDFAPVLAQQSAKEFQEDRHSEALLED